MHARLVVSGRGTHETSLGCLEPRKPEGRRRPHEEAGEGAEAEASAAKLRHCCYCYCCCSCMRHIIQIVRGREARLPPGDQTITYWGCPKTGRLEGHPNTHEEARPVPQGSEIHMTSLYTLYDHCLSLSNSSSMKDTNT